jgi:hypothetical protein
MTAQQLRHIAAATHQQHIVDNHGQRHYFMSAPRCVVSCRVPEPLRDYVVKRTLGGEHHAAARLNEILWTKLYEFTRNNNFQDYVTNPTNYDLLCRRLALAQLVIETRVHRSPDSDATCGEPD